MSAGVVDSAVNLTSASTTSPMNLAMPRLLSVWEASVSSRQGAPPFNKQVPAAEPRGASGTWRPQRPAARLLAGKSPPPRTTTSPWGGGARASTSLTGARAAGLQPSTTAADSIPPLRIARPQHLQASDDVILRYRW